MENIDKKPKLKIGRPRTVSLEPDEMKKLGQEMLDWVAENDPLHLSQWYTIHMGITYNQWKAMIAMPEFLPYYEQALKLVGLKYLDGESKRVKEGISQRWQRIYFKDLKEEEDETAAYNAALKREEQGKVSLDLVNRVGDFINAVSQAHSARRIADNSINADTKS